MRCHINKTDPNHMPLDKQIQKNIQTFANLSKNAIEKHTIKGKEKQLESFLHTHKRKKQK